MNVIGLDGYTAGSLAPQHGAVGNEQFAQAVEVQQEQRCYAADAPGHVQVRVDVLLSVEACVAGSHLVREGGIGEQPSVRA